MIARNTHISFSQIMALIGALVWLSSCSTVVDGRTQKVLVDTYPSGARCEVKSNDDVLAVVEHTPSTVNLEKSKNDVLVVCNKPGYLTGKKKNLSEYAATNLGNVIVPFGFIGSAIDSMTGAANKYDSMVLIKLEEAPPMAQPMPVIYGDAQSMMYVPYFVPGTPPVQHAYPVYHQAPNPGYLAYPHATGAAAQGVYAPNDLE